MLSSSCITCGRRHLGSRAVWFKLRASSEVLIHYTYKSQTSHFSRSLISVPVVPWAYSTVQHGSNCVSHPLARACCYLVRCCSVINGLKFSQRMSQCPLPIPWQRQCKPRGVQGRFRLRRTFRPSAHLLLVIYWPVWPCRPHTMCVFENAKCSHSRSTLPWMALLFYQTRNDCCTQAATPISHLLVDPSLSSQVSFDSPLAPLRSEDKLDAPLTCHSSYCAGDCQATFIHLRDINKSFFKLKRSAIMFLARTEIPSIINLSARKFSCCQRWNVNWCLK